MKLLIAPYAWPCKLYAGNTYWLFKLLMQWAYLVDFLLWKSLLKIVIEQGIVIRREKAMGISLADLQSILSRNFWLRRSLRNFKTHVTIAKTFFFFCRIILLCFVPRSRGDPDNFFFALIISLE